MTGHDSAAPDARAARTSASWPPGFPGHFIGENGAIYVSNVKGVDGFQYATGGSCRLDLADLCSFLQFTMTNSVHLPPEIYSGIYSRAWPELHSDTSASWHVASKGYLFHEGGTGRGEVACVSADPRTGNGFAV